MAVIMGPNGCFEGAATINGNAGNMHGENAMRIPANQSDNIGIETLAYQGFDFIFIG